MSLKKYYGQTVTIVADNGEVFCGIVDTYFFPDGRIRIGSINNPKFEVRPDGTLISKGGSITITKGLRTIFQADEDGFTLADGKFVYTEDDDTLKLTDVKLAWVDENNPPTLEQYLKDLADSKSTIYTTMPDNPQVGDFLVPTEDITHNDTTYYKGRVYRYTENKTWVEVDYTNTGVFNSLKDDVTRNGRKISNIFHYNTEITENSIISPAIGGGYLNISGTNNSRVIIDPSSVDNANDGDYIFLINNGTENTLSIDRNGSAWFNGNITMNGGSIVWSNIDETGSDAYKKADAAASTASTASIDASNALIDIANLAKGEYTKGTKTFIHGKGIYGPTIVGGKLYAANIDESTKDYTEITKEGLSIYRETSGSKTPKFEILVGDERYTGTDNYKNTIRIAIGAGEITDQEQAGGWEDKGRLILEKDETNTGRIYVKGGTEQYSGIIFNYNKLSFFEGSTIDFTGCKVIGLEGVEGGTAVFG